MAAIPTEDQIYDKGRADGQHGEPDWVYLGDLMAAKVKEAPYWRGFDDTKPAATVDMNTADASLDEEERMSVTVPDTLKDLIADSILAEVRAVVRGGRNRLVDPPPADLILAEDVETAITDILGDESGGRIRAWRTIDVPEGWFNRIGPDTDFGTFWSADEAYTMGYHGLEEFQAKIEAVIPLGSIDWPGTIATRLNNAEQEVRVLDKHPVEPLSVSRSRGGEDDWDVVWTASPAAGPRR